ncbi:MAG: hypothetical protein JNM36_15365 [Chitinophagales bacterium]|nr:hypothetical protein [Chitinophagales bacterium]
MKPSIIIIILLLCSHFLVAQGFYTTFGQNRVQYDKFIWSYYESENFRTYFYQGGYDIAKFAATVGERSLNDIEAKLEFKNGAKVEIMVYHTLSDLKQTNIGTNIEANNTGGVTKIIGNKIFVYFDGNYQHLATQIREGVARVSIERMVFGTNIQEILQNAVMLNLPDWLTNGLVAYIGEEWNSELDNRLRQEILSNGFDNFVTLSGDRATLAGHALWHYIALLHGHSAIPNILYLTRVNRSAESAFLFVLGTPISATVEDFNEYYRQLYQSETNNRQKISANTETLHAKLRNNGDRRQVVGQVRISPNGQYIAYTTNEIGRQLVWVYDTKTNTKKRVLANGFKSYKQPWKENYPLIAWDARSQQLAIVYERRDETLLTIYHPEEDEKFKSPNITKFQQVLSIDFTNSLQMVFTAVQAGQVDLFLYDLPTTKVTPLTNDFYPELQARYVRLKDRRGIAFLSNRTNDTLRLAKLDTLMPLDNYDIFFYDLDKNTPAIEEGQSTVLARLTQTPFANEQLPMQYDSTYLVYVGDENGINNRYALYFDSLLVRTDIKTIFRDSLTLNRHYTTQQIAEYRAKGILERIDTLPIYKTIGHSFAISNYEKGISLQDVSRNQQLAMVYFENQQYKLVRQNITDTLPLLSQKLENTAFRNQLEQKDKKPPRKPKLNNNPSSSSDGNHTTPKSVDTPPNNKDNENYYFQSDFDNYMPQTSSDSAKNTLIVTPPVRKTAPVATEPKTFFKRTDVRIYIPQYSIDNLVSQVDNTLIFTPYQPFLGSGVPFNLPDLNALIKVGVVDLFEDHRITGGFRLPLALNGTEYFIQYDDVKKRLDKRFTFYRRSTGGALKQTTNLAEYTLTYPFDTYRSLSLTTGLRNERFVFRATDVNTLLTPIFPFSWVNTKLSYVFDNTINTGLNFYNGTRYKVYVEFQKPFDAIINSQQFDLRFKNTGFTGIVGGDFRHYQKVHRQVIWANRLAVAHSFGSQKMLYYLGGVENWLVFNPEKQFDSTNPIDETTTYGFQSLGTNLRGFKQNVRNGTSYIVLNSELRIPVFRYLINTPINSELIKNFQVIGFADVGSAWMGVSPFDEESQYVTVIVGEPPVSATVKYFRSPIVGGYGVGFRTKLLGYFVRTDIAWGVDSGTRSKAMTYFSLGMDF